MCCNTCKIMSIELDANDRKRFDETIDKIEALADGVLQEELEDMTIDMLGRMVKEAPVDTGNLRQNIDFQATEDGVTVTSVALTNNNQDYAPYQEYGTRFQPAQPYFWHNVRKGVRDLNERVLTRLKNITK